jgi:hypothetical protein
MMGLLRHRARHRTFVCYHAADRDEVRAFVDFFDHGQDVLLYHEASVESDQQVLTSHDADSMMARIRTHYLADSIVTLVLVGRCTWAARTVDWSIRASLLPAGPGPNGLFAVVLPSAGSNVRLPLRLQMNLSSGYARIYPYTTNLNQLGHYLHTAYHMRETQAHQRINPDDMQAEDAPCP